MVACKYVAATKVVLLQGMGHRMDGVAGFFEERVEEIEKVDRDGNSWLRGRSGEETVGDEALGNRLTFTSLYVHHPEVCTK